MRGRIRRRDVLEGPADGKVARSKANLGLFGNVAWNGLGEAVGL